MHVGEGVDIEGVLRGASQTLAEEGVDVVTFDLGVGRNRTELPRIVEAFRRLGFRTLMAGTHRLLALDDYMWHDGYTRALPPQGFFHTKEEGARSGGEAPSSFLYVAIRATAAHYRPLLALYNASGMVPDCSPVRLASFHSSGYDADDCPPNFGVYRTSRVKLFEDPALQDMLHPYSLLHWRHNVYSEAGEDGIIQYLASRLGFEEDGFCFEFGAWDGLFASNCRYWIEQGWDGLLVELDSDKFKELRKNYRNLPGVSLVNAAVQSEGPNSICNLASQHAGLREVDVLSIDVDGLDFELLASLEHHQSCRPKIIIVETNGFIRPDLTASLPRDAASNNLQQSLAVFKALAERLGYRMVAFTQNAILLRRDLAEQLEAIRRATTTSEEEGGVNVPEGEGAGEGPEGGPWPEALNRLYLDALVINWNDMRLNVEATRSGAPKELIEAETKEFGGFEAKLDLERLRTLAILEEQTAAL